MSKERKGAREAMLADCALCPRRCHINRKAGARGFCGQGAEIVAARASLHFWEEPCISGTAGSGTVFFCGCGLGCVYCQNAAISGGAKGGGRGQEPAGGRAADDHLPDGWRRLSAGQLSDIFRRLEEAGACNINLVTPAHFVPRIAEAIETARERGLDIPVVCNTGGYETVEALKLLDGLVDIYLADCKYCSPVLSARYSQAPDYFAACRAALAEMVRQTGAPRFRAADGRELDAQAYNAAVCGDEGAREPDPAFSAGASDGAARQDACDSSDYAGPLMTRGTIVRHLMLPGCSADSRRVVDFVLETFGEAVYLSLMNQYTPMPAAARFPELARRVSGEEYEALIDYALEKGLANGFFQGEDTDRSSFIPAFDGRGLGEGTAVF